jgi:tyrosyl-tRNA synthetase
MPNLIDVLRERGFLEQTTPEDELRAYLDSGSVSGYIGFDPTASSLHVGSLVPIMALAHMQRLGHRPIALVGGGTGLVGDPSGKTEMRQILTAESVEQNVLGLKRQLQRFIDFENDRALMVNNADWLVGLHYIPFLRDYGRHFSVNRMMKAESYRMRLESEEGLSFIEFNYMLLQAYDFCELFKTQGCRLQMGGSDQWGNIVAGVELVRKVCREAAHGITFPLITTSNGAKMGKTAQGAVWLDAQRTSPYEYFQFWVNSDDRDVGRFLSLFTFLPIPEIRKVEVLVGVDINMAKRILAFETTQLAHGRQAAREALQAAASLFGEKPIPLDLLPSSTIPREIESHCDGTIPTSEINLAELEAGVPAFKLFVRFELTDSSGAARRLIKQGGAYINGVRVTDFDQIIDHNDIRGGEIMLRAGKKRFHRIAAPIDAE